MNKFVRITAIMAIVSAVIDFFVGRIIVPLVYLFITSRQMLAGSGFTTGVLTFFGLRIFDLLGVFVIALLAVLIIVGIKSGKDKIGMEIAGLIIMGLSPFASLIVTLFATVVVRFLSMRGVAFFSAYSILNSGSALGSLFHNLTVALIVMSLTGSICRKRWSRDEEFDKD